MFPPATHVSIDLCAGDSLGRISQARFRTGDAHCPSTPRRFRLSQHPLPVSLHQGKTRPDLQPRNQTKCLKIQEREAQEGEQPGLRRRNSRRSHRAAAHNRKGICLHLISSSFAAHLATAAYSTSQIISTRFQSLFRRSFSSSTRPRKTMFPILTFNVDTAFPPA